MTVTNYEKFLRCARAFDNVDRGDVGRTETQVKRTVFSAEAAIFLLMHEKGEQARVKPAIEHSWTLKSRRRALVEMAPAVAGRLDRFLDSVERDHGSTRRALVEYRIWEPFIVFSPLERQLQELAAVEVRQFIDAGMLREKIMLNRESDTRRAVIVSGGLVSSSLDNETKARFASLADPRF